MNLSIGDTANEILRSNAARANFKCQIFLTFLFTMLSSPAGYLFAQNAYVSWDPIYPAPAYDTYEWTMTVVNLPSTDSYYYWAIQNGFVGGTDAFYMGLQPNGSCGITNNGTCKIALFSFFGNGASSTSPNCSSGADGGPGESCRIPYSWVIGRPYTFRATLTETDSTNETWTGTVLDTATGVQTTIGSWSIPVSHGLIGAQGISFTEYYASLGGNCVAEPYAMVNWNIPIGYNNGQAYVGSVRSTSGLTGCPNNMSFQVGSRSVVVQTGGSLPQPSTGVQFVPISPCRAADTRGTNGALGGPELAGNSTRTFPISASTCGIPANASAYSLNVTVVPDAGLGYLSIWPSGQTQPLVSTLNSDGRVKASAAIVPAGSSGGVDVYVSNASHVILDINGYFIGGSSSALDFYPLIPCRIADTRTGNGSLGGPSLTGGAARSFPILASSCNIPGTAQAYSLNLTAIPHSWLGYLSVWPTGQTQPLVSTLNSPGAVTANAAILAAGTGGAITTYASNDTDLVIDINGYFAPQSASGLSLYTLTPCRALDTRTSTGEFVGSLVTNVVASSCPVSPLAQAHVLSSTVVPLGGLGYLTLWSPGVNQPSVSTLNSDGSITSNMAIVPTQNGSVSAYASDPTQLILDVSAYFAPHP